MEIFRNISAYIFLIALITDYLDGYIARNFNQSTAFGAFLDPVADKALSCNNNFFITWYI